MRGLLFISLASLLSSCTTVSDVVDDGDHVFVESDLDEDALAKSLGRADSLYAQPRDADRVASSLSSALGAISARNDYAAVPKALRAYAWLALRHPDRDQRLSFGEEGIALGSQGFDPTNVKRAAETRHYIALTMAAYCQEKGTCAPEFVRAMRDHAQAAEKLDPTVDNCGPPRFLGQLILGTLDYPAYEIGSLEDAIAALRRAGKACSDFPENWLSLGEALFEDGDDEAARELLERVVSSEAPSDLSVEHAEWVEKAKELLTEL